MEVSRPIGRISVVTMAKMPIVTETTAAQEARLERLPGAVVGVRAGAAVRMNVGPVFCPDELRSVPPHQDAPQDAGTKATSTA
jgi:hypothetical protein